jgi:ubiquinone/menaquinone biosynthesis C-methylase UbiE
MSFSSFFSEQARNPKGFFGRVIMSTIFNIGNAKLNKLVYDMMSVQENDYIIEIGFGTGKLLYKIARQLDRGLVEGIDFSKSMISIAEKQNRFYIKKGKVRILEGDFNDIPFEKEHYNTVCSVNTIYFWDKPDFTLKKIADILKPKGKFVVGFENIDQLKNRKLNNNIFHLYSIPEVKNLFLEAGFKNGIENESKKIGSSVLNCIVAVK